MWYFGMKAHVGTDKRGTVHSLVTTDAAAADINQLPDLMHGSERELYGDKAYWCEGDRQAFGFSRRSVRRKAKAWPGCTLRELDSWGAPALLVRFERDYLYSMLDAA